jgi:hypothetical protein
MKKINNLVSERSNCCNYRVVIRGKVTIHYVCLACGEACDIHFIERKLWARNPKTQIIPNKKKKSSTKLNPKELKEIHKSEDF